MIYSIRNGRVTAAVVRAAPDASLIPDTPQPAAAAEEPQMEQEVPNVHRNSISEGLPRPTVHRATAQAPVHQGPTDRTAGQDTAQGPHRQVQEAETGEGARGLSLFRLGERGGGPADGRRAQ